MKQRTAARLAWSIWALFVIGAVPGMVLVAVNGHSIGEQSFFGFVFLATATVGALIASRQPQNPIGWIFLFIATGVLIGFVGGEYGTYALRDDPGSPPGGVWGAWISTWVWIAAIGPMVTLLPLLFPDGKPLSPRWRAVAWLSCGVLALISVLGALTPGTLEGTSVANPVGIQGAGGLFENLIGFLFLVGLLPLAVASAISLILRYRRSHGEDRLRIKWFAFAIALLVVEFIVSGVLEGFGISEPAILTVIAALVFLGIPVATGIAILKYRLYDIDIVIKKTVVYGLLAAFMTTVYAAIVVGIGAVVAGTTSNTFFTMVAAVLIAVSFQPVRARVTHLANRLVYGKRATPYEVLSEFSERMGETYAADDLLPRMARILSEGTGAERADVWLKVGSELRVAASWPSGGDDPRPRVLANGLLPDLPGAEAAYPVQHQGELLGALAIAKSRDESLQPAEEKLAADLAAQAGLVLRNVRLTAELQANLEELRASRQRIVAAQDAERRRIERNIHDGAQQQLVALAVKARLARNLAERDPAKALDRFEEVESDAHRTLEDLRDLARGIYPPLLADKGLGAALAAQARRAAVPVEVLDDGIGRQPEDVEAAVYFCCLEALQNVAKYANASGARISLTAGEAVLVFEVSDDGMGFDPSSTGYGTGLQGMADRLAALDGALEVRSGRGEGTTVIGRIPVSRPGA